VTISNGWEKIAHNFLIKEHQDDEMQHDKQHIREPRRRPTFIKKLWGKA